MEFSNLFYVCPVRLIPARQGAEAAEPALPEIRKILAERLSATHT